MKLLLPGFFRPACLALTLLTLLIACSSATDDTERPVAVAGADVVVAVGETVTLDASGSSDPLGGELTYAWTLSQAPPGSTAAIDDAERVSASIAPDREGEYVITLQVTTAAGSDSDQLTVTARSGTSGAMTLEPGGSVSHADGAHVFAQDDSISGPVQIVIEPGEGPPLDPPLPPSVEQVGQAFTFSSPDSASADPGHPFLIGLRVPEGESPTHLAIGILEVDALMVPPVDEDAEPGPEWTFLPGTHDPEAGLLLAAAYGVPPYGWTATIVRSDSFNSGTVMDGEPVQTAQAATFKGICSALFDTAVESCTATSETDAAEALEDAYLALTGAGFGQPRLWREVLLFKNPAGFYVSMMGAYLIELRPESTAVAGGMYTSGVGSIWLAIDDGGITAAREGTVRHEYVHATQFGYDPASAQEGRWSLEGQAVFMQGDVINPARNPQAVRNMSYKLTRSRWTGSAWGPAPNSEYHAQDFWAYLAARFGHSTSDFLIPFMESGQTTAAVDTALRSEYPASFGGAGLSGGLSSAYWDWVKNYVFENAVQVPGLTGDTCTYRPGTADLEFIPYDLNGVTPSVADTLDPLATAVIRVRLPVSPGGPYEAPILVDLEDSHLRSNIYLDDPGSTGCHGQADRTATDATAANSEIYYVVISNVSQSEDASYTVSFPDLTITSPQAGPSLEEGPFEFRASSTQDLDTLITWRRQRPSEAIPFTMGTTDSGETLTRTLCDGAHHITARAWVDGHPVSRSITLNVADLGHADPPTSCAPNVSIVQPLADSTVPLNTPVEVIAETHVAGGGRTDYPVTWRLGSQAGEVVGNGVSTTVSFDTPGDHTLHVSYGAATDSVDIVVVAGSPPEVQILAPQDDAQYYWYEHPGNPNGITVSFEGEASIDGTPLTGDALTWRIRRMPGGAWTDAGQGSAPEIFFTYFGSDVYQDWEVLLRAADGDTGIFGSDSIQIGVMRPPD